MPLKDLLKGRLTKLQLTLVPSSFDVIGNKDKAAAIIEIPEELKKKQKIIAEALMKQHKNVVSVLEKASPRKGIYRTRKLKLIAGKRNTEVIHMESGCRFLLDPKKVYFSPREGTERSRIAEKVKPNETVIVFFAGVGPFPIIIAKKSKPARVIGIEINPDAVEYFRKNAKLNKLSNVEAVLGDVKEKAEEFYGTCDRVIMPLPETAVDYLEEAAKCIRSKGTVHLYFFSEEGKLSEWKEKVKEKIPGAKIEEIQKVLPYGPKIWKYRIDIKIF